MKPYFFLAFLFAGLVSITHSSFAGVKDSIGVVRLNNQMHIQYLVEPGETIYGLSTRFMVSVSELMEINPDLENGLKVGQLIHIPYYPERLKAQEVKRSGGAVTYKVQPGDTYYGIAKKYNISVEELLKMNNMDLKAGQEIIIGYPKTESQTMPAVTKSDTSKMAPDQVVVTAPKELTELEKAQAVFGADFKPYPFDPDRKQVLVIPFDPYLYFSDADDEIAAKSKLPRNKVREVFRRRLNSLLLAQGYETIFLLGGKTADSISDLNKIYSSVTYHYQEVLYNPESPYYQKQEEISKQQGTNKSWLDRQKDKITTVNNDGVASKTERPSDMGKYFGVKIKDPNFFTYFSAKYSIDYYIFMNQFEVKTNYENCLDRAALNYERTFTVHFSIFDVNGKQVAGDKFKTHYNSNSNYIYQIVSDNMPQVAERILSELPPPNANTTER